MSQFCGYTLEIVMRDPAHTTIKGIIKKIVDKNVTVSNPVYLDGTVFQDKEVTVKGEDIKDLIVVDLPSKKGKKGKKGKMGKVVQKGVSGNGGSNSNEENMVYRAADHPNEYGNGNGGGNVGEDWDNAKTVKQMDDFDFESNLEKFDKASVFKEIAEQDTMNPAERLVSINKVDPDQVKYGNDEMVLDNQADDVWDSIDVDDRSSRRNKSSKKNKQKRSDSRVATPSVDQVRLVVAGSSENVASCSPLQLAEIEMLSSEKFQCGLDVVAENAGRGVANLVVERVLGSFRLGSNNHNTPPLALVLAGNNRTGALALVAGRHLFNHGVRVITYLLHDFDRSEDDLEDAVDRELERFKLCGGKTVTKIAQLDLLLGKLDTPLEFVVDGLQGYDSDLNDLVEPELGDAQQLVEWCNLREIPILSIDIPSGINASSGSAEAGFLQSQYVISTGLPLSSLLNLYKFGYFTKGQLTHYMIDTGIPRKVFSTKSSLRKFEKGWYGASWAVQLNAL